jgi:hypothetical protein
VSIEPSIPPVHDSASAMVSPRSRSVRPTPIDLLGGALGELHGLADVRRLGVHLQLDLGKARPVADGDPGKLRLDALQPLPERRLAEAEGAQVDLVARAHDQRGDLRQDARLVDVLHLARHAGHEEQLAAIERDAEAGRGAALVGEDLGARGEVGLLQIVRRQDAAVVGGQLVQVIDDLLVALHRHAHRLRHRFGGEVVGGGAEPAGRDHHAMAPRQVAHRFGDARHVVIDGEVLAHLEAELGELVGEPGCVAVDELAPRELGSDREDGRRHESVNLL